MGELHCVHTKQGTQLTKSKKGKGKITKNWRELYCCLSWVPAGWWQCSKYSLAWCCCKTSGSMWQVRWSKSTCKTATLRLLNIILSLSPNKSFLTSVLLTFPYFTCPLQSSSLANCLFHRSGFLCLKEKWYHFYPRELTFQLCLHQELWLLGNSLFSAKRAQSPMSHV